MAEKTELDELKALKSELKARNSDLSRDLDHARKEITALTRRLDEVAALEDALADANAELEAANKLNKALSEDAAQAAVNTSRDQKRAEAFLAIRAALETK